MVDRNFLYDSLWLTKYDDDCKKTEPVLPLHIVTKSWRLTEQKKNNNIEEKRKKNTNGIRMIWKPLNSKRINNVLSTYEYFLATATATLVSYTIHYYWLFHVCFIFHYHHFYFLFFFHISTFFFPSIKSSVCTVYCTLYDGVCVLNVNSLLYTILRVVYLSL